MYMNRSRHKKTLKTLTALVIVLVGLWVSITSVLNLWKTKRQLDDLRGEVMALRSEDDKLKENEQYKGDPLYVEKEARDKLNLVKPNEKVVDISGNVDPLSGKSDGDDATVDISSRELWVLLLSGGLN